MRLPPGTRLGVYEIIAAIGEGGMGAVFRARDTKLDRDVAIKVLPEAFAHDTDRLARFTREAKTLAALNHPHIAAIYGLEESAPSTGSGQAGVTALVMELVEGDDLSQRIARGAIPIDDALPIAKQIAEALEAAHEQGIIHRDLKPSNIKVRADGTVKVLDFGLAKALDQGSGIRDQGSGGAANSPTITSPAMPFDWRSGHPEQGRGVTQAGMILGTAAYMAPEQARGKAVDRRADIWAFGVVLFEMLTGKRAFPGEDLTDTLAAVVKLEPNWDALGPNVTARVRQVLRMCLQKDPKQRLGDIHDVRLALDGAFDATETTPPPTRSRTPWVAAALLAALAVVGWMRPGSSGDADQPDLTLTIAPLAATGIRPIVEFSSEPIISPDGMSVMYRDRTGRYRLRRLDSLDAEALPFPGGFSDFGLWSRDSRTFMTDANGELWQIRLPGGSAERVANAGGPVLGASRSRDGDLVFAVVKTAVGLFRLAPSGGEPQPVTLPGLPPGSYFWPEFISGTNDFIVTFEVPGSLESEIYLATLRDGQPADPVLLMRNRTAPHHTLARGGRLLFVRDSVLFAQALNLTTRQLEGDPEVVANGVGSAPAQKSAKFSVSTTGVIAWRSGVESSAQMVTFDRQGQRVGTSGVPGLMYFVRLSPDERRLLVAGPDGQRLLEPGQPGELVLSRMRSFMTTLWAPDNRRFLVPEPGRVSERAVGGGDLRELVAVAGLDRLEDVSDDGRVALFTRGALASEVFAVDLDGRGAPRAVLQTGEKVFNTRFSPDARWIVYEAHPPGRTTGGIYVQPFPGPGLRRQISATGRFPVWRRDGREIVFLDQGKVWSIGVAITGDDVAFAAAVALFPVGLTGGVEDLTLLAITRDGSRVYLPQLVEQPDSDVIHLRTGWSGS